MQFICYSKCGTCKKAEKWLDEKGIKYEKRDIKEDNPSAEELERFTALSALPLKKLFNTSGLLYKSMELKDKLPDMSDEDKIQLLSTDGMLVKRPILVLENKVLVGFKEEEWEKELL